MSRENSAPPFYSQKEALPILQRTEEEPQEEQEKKLTPEERTYQAITDRMIIKYGRLRENHPAQVFAQDSLMKSRRPEDRTIPGKVIVLPNMREANAMVLPDGTIFASLALLELIDYQEGMIGVLGHELKHAESQDSKIKQQAIVREVTDIESYIENQLTQTSISKLLEERADLKGAIIDQDRAGNNPMGFKMFLYKLSTDQLARYGKKQVSTTHIRSIDRALTVGIFAKYYPLPSTEKALTPIPTEEKNNWRKKIAIAIQENPGTFLSPLGHLSDADRKKALHREIAALKNMNDHQLTATTAAMLNHWTTKTPTGDYRKRVTSLLQQSVVEMDNRVKKRYTIETEDQTQQRGLARLAYFALYVGADLSFKAEDLKGKMHEDIYKKLKQPIAFLRSTEAYEQLRDIIAQMADDELPCALGNPKIFMQTCLRIRSVNQSVFGELQAHKFRVASWYQEAAALAKSLEEFSNKKALSPVDETTLITAAVQTVREQIVASNDTVLLNEFDQYIIEQKPEVLPVKNEQKTPENSYFTLSLIEKFQPATDETDLQGVAHYNAVVNKMILNFNNTFLKAYNATSDNKQKLELIKKGMVDFVHYITTELAGVTDYRLVLAMIDRGMENMLIFAPEFIKTSEAVYHFTHRRESNLNEYEAKTRRQYTIGYQSIANLVNFIHTHPACQVIPSIYREAIFNIFDEKQLSHSNYHRRLKEVRMEKIDYDEYDDELIDNIREIKNIEQSIETEDTAIELFEKAAQKTCNLTEAEFELLLNISPYLSTEQLSSLDKGSSTFMTSVLEVLAYQSDMTMHGKFEALPTIYLVKKLIQLPSEQVFPKIFEYESRGVAARDYLFRKAALPYAAPLLAHIMPNLDTLLATPYATEVSNFVDRTLDDPLLKVAFSSYIIRKEYEKTDNFNEKIDRAFGSRKKSDGKEADIALVNRLIEQDMKTEAEYRAVKRTFHETFTELAEEGDVKLGAVLMWDTTNLLTRDPLKLLQLLLGTRSNDQAIKEEVFTSFDYEELVSKTKDEKLFKFNQRKIQNLLISIDRGIRISYAASDQARSLLVKRLLLDSGVMMSQEQRTAAVNALFAEAIRTQPNIPAKKDEINLYHFLQQIAAAVGQNDDWELTFYTLAPIIADNIMRPPQKSTPWHDIYDVENTFMADYHLQNLMKRKQLPRDATQNPWRYNSSYGDKAAKSLTTYLQEHDALENRKHVDKLSPTEFVVEAAPRMGALAVRMLQLLPQFVEIPTANQEIFNTLYDKMRGQLKIVAIETVEEEWKRVTNGGSMWDTIEEFGDNIGGGSLMTVYRVKRKNGENRVIRVVNPNIIYHLETSRTFISNLIHDLQHMNAIDDNIRDQLLAALDLVSEWIRDELKFDNFFENDAKFKTQNDGFTIEGSQYAIKVPQSEGPAAAIFQMEEEIKGTNLTEWDTLVAAGHDMQQIVSLITQSYREQMKNGLLHGDIHIGNYAVTPDNKIAVFDRTYYVQLSDKEINLFSSIMDGQLDWTVAADYLKTLLPENSNVQITTLIPELISMGQSITNKDFAGVNKTLVRLRRQGIQIPLKISILLKNIHALSKLSEKAGIIL